METPVEMLNINDVIRRFEKLSEDNILMDPEYTRECSQILLWLNELRERREKDCYCELIPIKNEKIDGGFMCIHCGKVFGEYCGEQIKAKTG